MTKYTRFNYDNLQGYKGFRNKTSHRLVKSFKFKYFDYVFNESIKNNVDSTIKYLQTEKIKKDSLINDKEKKSFKHFDTSIKSEKLINIDELLKM